ncbi:SH3-domain-containing protein [Peniophora sp. CONT]|nr:SH3-domain-containing protein [Peniophora sp. CONT]
MVLSEPRALLGRVALEDRPISVPFPARRTAAATASTDSQDPERPATHDSRATTFPWVNEDGGSAKLLCRALYDHSSMDENTLSFRRGAVIEVLARIESGWWDGALDDERGWFPSNYVQILEGDVSALAAIESVSPSLSRTHRSEQSAHKVHPAFTSRYAPDAMSYMRHAKETIHKVSYACCCSACN